MASGLQAFFVWIEPSRGTGPRATVKPFLRKSSSPDLNLFEIWRAQTTESGSGERKLQNKETFSSLHIFPQNMLY